MKKETIIIQQELTIYYRGGKHKETSRAKAMSRINRKLSAKEFVESDGSGSSWYIEAGLINLIKK